MNRRSYLDEFAAARSVKDHLAAVASASLKLNGTIETFRHVMEYYSDNGTPRPLSCPSWVATEAPVAGEWFVPPDADQSRRCLYIHGGGWVAGSIDTHRHLIDAIATESGVPVFAIDYRLAPEAPFPAGLEDCITVAQWLRHNGPNGPSEPCQITVGGDSAGGNYAAALTIDALVNGKQPPDALILISPVTDFRPPEKPPVGVMDPIASGEGREPVYGYYVTNGETPDNPLISPRAASDDILARFPPTLIQIGGDEVLRDQGVDFAAALWESDAPVHLSVWPYMPHVFQLFLGDLESAHRAVLEMAEFINR